MSVVGLEDPEMTGPDPESRYVLATVTIAEPVGEGVVDLEHPQMTGQDPEREFAENSLSPSPRVQQIETGGSSSPCILEESRPLATPEVRVLPAEESRSLNNSSMLATLKRLPPSVAQLQPKTRCEASDHPPPFQPVSDSSQRLDDGLDDTRVRKKAKTAVFQKALDEESQDSLQNEVISVKREISAPIDRLVAIDQASSSAFAPFPSNAYYRSSSPHRTKQSPFTPLVGSKRVSAANDAVSWPQPASRPASKSSVDSSGTKTPRSSINAVSTSPIDSINPNSWMRSTRSTARDEHKSSPSMDTSPSRVFFASSSSAGDLEPVLRCLSKKGAKKVKSIRDCTVLCVGKELKKTGKLILAVLLGKDIVTDA